MTIALTTGDPGEHEVQIFAQEFGGDRILIATPAIPAGETYSFTTPIERETTFTVEYAGDAATGSAASSTTVGAHASVHSAAQGYTSKGTRYYHWPLGRRVYVVGDVTPNHRGDCAVFTRQFLVKGRWGNTEYIRCVRLDSLSRAGVYLPQKQHLIRYPFRIRADFIGANGNLGSSSDWIYGRYDLLTHPVGSRSAPPATG